MSTAEYCSELKNLTDKLYDVGTAVTDQALVINTLCVLNPMFGQAITVLGAMKPPPSFVYACSFLMREEKRIAHSHKMEAQIALLAAGSSTKPSPLSPPATATGGGDCCKKCKARAT